MISQTQDFVWYSGFTVDGYCCAHFFSFSDTGYTKDFITLDPTDLIRDGSGKATMADESGELLFYTDGFDVFNRKHQIMLNGDSVFAMEGQILGYYEWPAGINIPDWSLILPCPFEPEIYYLIYLGIMDDEVSPSQFRGSGLNFSKINMQLDKGLGAVTKKNINVKEFRSTHSSLKAIRHGNGRDWWIPVKEFENANWHVFLLDDTGIHFSHMSDDPEFPEFYCRLALYSYALDQYVCMTGDHFYPWQFYHDRPFEYQFHVYDFDRCAGTFKYDRTFELETWSLKYSLKSLTFCPNGQYLYGGLGGSFLIQYDTWVEDVQATADTLLNIFTMDNAVPGIYEPKITPRGELWLQSWGSDSITVIQNPESRGEAVNISENFIVTDWLNQGTFPNNANYRIGPKDGSPCDTLGIDNEPRAWFRYNDANLGPYERRFVDISYFRPESWHWNFDDGSTYDGQHPGVHDFPAPGNYYVCLTVSNENAEDTYCEWVEIEEPSNVHEQMEGRGFVLFPNPNRGLFQLQFSNALSDGGDLRVINTMGQQLHKETLSSGGHQFSLDLSHLPSGQYIVQVQTGSNLFSQSVVVMR